MNFRNLPLFIVACFAAAALTAPLSAAAQDTDTVQLRGTIIDQDTGDPIEARLYIESADGKWFLATSDGGVAIPYEKQRNEKSVEIHTSLSAHPFKADLPPGSYTLTVERGKEFRPTTQVITLADAPVETKITIGQWIDMNSLGWFSGETHVHRPVEDLKTLLLCEDLNVGLPLTSWVSRAEDTPLRDNRNKEPVPPGELIEVDDTHVIWPVNTEYEIGSIKKERHTFGAVFVLNHKQPLEVAAMPAGSVAIEARKQGALLDLDKHNWPWSMMLVPAIRVDLFELTNNHLWRTDFAFKTFFPEFIPEYMNIQKDAEGYTERGWIDFGLQTYYALLNCGFDMKPSAGTASGVHPVPLGFGRVYVKLNGPFRYESWINGLRDGRSFVTTGPMLDVQFNGRNPGTRFPLAVADQGKVRVTGSAASLDPLLSIEIIVNGEVVRAIPSANEAAGRVPFSTTFDTLISVPESSWVAVRTFTAREDGRPRFAHTAPIHIDIEDKPLRPKRVEVEALLKRVREELARNESVLSGRSLGEYQKAVRFYEALLEKAE